jgi:hypothetical protein
VHLFNLYLPPSCGPQGTAFASVHMGARPSNQDLVFDSLEVEDALVAVGVTDPLSRTAVCSLVMDHAGDAVNWPSLVPLLSQCGMDSLTSLRVRVHLLQVPCLHTPKVPR